MYIFTYSVIKDETPKYCDSELMCPIMCHLTVLKPYLKTMHDEMVGRIFGGITEMLIPLCIE